VNLTPSENAVVKAVAGDPSIVAKVKAAATTYAPELATAAKVDPATTAALAANPADPAAQAKAVADIAGVPVTTVAQVMVAGQHAKAGQATPVELKLLATDGAKVQFAAAQLKAAAAVPTPVKQLLRTYGPGLKDPKVQSALVYLQAHGADVKKAAAAAPHQWQHLLWIAVGGQIVFIPLIFVMVGAWDPRKARRQAAEHEAWLQAQLAADDADTRPAQLV
jgi:hypothetical protein